MMHQAGMDCAMCEEACDASTAIADNIIMRTEYFVVGINPRWSPHLGRVFIAPLRHIGPEGVYGFETLTTEEHKEFILLRRKITDALILAFTQYGLKIRDGCAHIDYIVRPSVHPSADLFPAFDGKPEFDGHTWPAYLPIKFEQGSAPSEIQGAPGILASFSNPALVMPVPLRKALCSSIVKVLRK
jgi:diadenosine tetraphosphate (Ap4A) HIT family hydrolase